MMPVAALSFVAALSACAPAALQPSGRATQPPPERTRPAAFEPSPESQALRVYYADLQSNLLSRGLLRTDDGSKDAPYSARLLANNFIRIALFDEFDGSGSTAVARPTESRLRRWATPVRLSVEFGASVPEAKRATERARIASFLARLSRISGHPISLVTSGANFHLHFVNEDERRAIGPTLARQMQGISAGEIREFTDLPPSTYCQVSAFVDNATSLYSRAFAVIRSEHSDLMSLACLHEEITQGLGLPNDSPQARPSIFNDDQEFALLTPMDELMLRMLYDRRLSPGMTIGQARPVIEAIAEQLTGGAS